MIGGVPCDLGELAEIELFWGVNFTKMLNCAVAEWFRCGAKECW